MIADLDNVALDAIETRLIVATVASCGCHTKTPDPAFHASNCLYRALADGLTAIRVMRPAYERDRG